ncbi:MAG: hypothetical protein ABIA21_04175, partial [Candidatus Aenigmatarchaeota archaeon]
CLGVLDHRVRSVDETKKIGMDNIQAVLEKGLQVLDDRKKDVFIEICEQFKMKLLTLENTF